MSEVGINVRDFLSGKRAGERQERAETAIIVREMAKIERRVGETWEKEAREQAPGADEFHLRACAAIGHCQIEFSNRLEELAKYIEDRGSEL